MKNSRPTKRHSKSNPIPAVPASFYKDLIDQVAEGIVTIGLDGRILYVNQAAVKMIDRPKAKIIGHYFTEFVESASLSESKNYFKKVKEGETILQKVISIKCGRNKIIPVEFTASPTFENGKVDQIYSIFRDISKRKEVEEFVRQSEKLNAIQHFIIGMAQEIRNPLKSLSDRLRKLVEEYRNKDFEYVGYKEFQQIFDTIRQMYERAEHSYKTTQRLLDISKNKIGVNGHSCQANNVIKEAVNKLKYSAGAADIAILLQLSRQLPEAKISAIELNQIIINILTNAIQSITYAGKIILKTRFLQKENKVIIECIDNGVGIAKDNLSKVFEPFYSTKPRGVEKSSGLGLSIVYAIVKRHKGEIHIKSNLREGTQVRLAFPAHKRKSH